MNDLLNFLSETSSTSGSPYQLLLPLALILILSKIFSIICKRVGLPQVVGFLFAGLLIGCIYLIPNQTILTDYTDKGINFLAKIGVVLIMFSAGLETNIKKIKQTGFSSIVVTTLGVLVPLGLGVLVAWLFLHGDASVSIWSILFYGVLLSATSVSITVTVLKEINKLDTKIGSCIVSAAILDDIIGIILLSLVLSLSNSSTGNSGVPFGIDTGIAGLNVFLIVVFMVGFFAICVLLSFPIKILFRWLDNKWPHHRRIPIFGFALAFLLAYCAEAFFGVADITGAFMAGILIAQTNTETKDYVDNKVIGETNIIFGPVFFCSIGMMLFNGNLDLTDLNFIFFGLTFVLVGLIGKVVGAGGGALLCKFSIKDSLKIGIGMMARAEVIVVCTQKGIDAGIIKSEIMPFVLFLIIISSFLTPIILRLLYKQELLEEAMNIPEVEPRKETTIQGK